MVRKRLGRMLIAAGALMLSLAAIFIYINLNEEAQGGRLASEDYRELIALVADRTESNNKCNTMETLISGDGGTSDRIDDSNEDEKQAVFTQNSGANSPLNIDNEAEQGVTGTMPTFSFDADTEMPTENVKGNQYIGILEFSERDLCLPVMSEWSYGRLRIAPCRYTGSVYSKDIVICGHNYSRHFGTLKNLKQGEKVCFTDVNGNLFRYSVMRTEILKPNEVDRMTAGDWDLTMFTCTYGGKTRVTVRCRLEEFLPVE